MPKQIAVGTHLVNPAVSLTKLVPVISKTMVDKECSMIVKTSKSKVKAAIKFIVKKHSYECPAVSSFPIKFAHKDFQRWINNQTTTKNKK